MMCNQAEVAKLMIRDHGFSSAICQGFFDAWATHEWVLNGKTETLFADGSLLIADPDTNYVQAISDESPTMLGGRFSL